MHLVWLRAAASTQIGAGRAAENTVLDRYPAGLDRYHAGLEQYPAGPDRYHASAAVLHHCRLAELL